jgi:hypothetical protein
MSLSKHSNKELYGGPKEEVSHRAMIGTEWKLNADFAFQSRFLEEQLHTPPFLHE